MSYISFCFQVHCCGAEKTLCLCLPPCLQLLGIACLSHWRIIWSKLVYDLGFKLSVCTPWQLLCFRQWFNWLFWSDSCSVSPVEIFLLNFLGYSFLSSVVCPSIYCIHSAAIFGVLYCKIIFPVYCLCFHPWWCILVLLVCSNGCEWVWFLPSPWYRCWSLQFARNFHPQRCGIIVWVVMFDLHHHLCCILAGVLPRVSFLFGDICKFPYGL